MKIQNRFINDWCYWVFDQSPNIGDEFDYYGLKYSIKTIDKEYVSMNFKRHSYTNKYIVEISND
jgi:hypothetical protein